MGWEDEVLVDFQAAPVNFKRKPVCERSSSRCTRTPHVLTGSGVAAQDEKAFKDITVPKLSGLRCVKPCDAQSPLVHFDVETTAIANGAGITQIAAAFGS